MVSSDTTRKIETLRKWANNPRRIKPEYLRDIANEMERIFNLMCSRYDEIEEASCERDCLLIHKGE